MFEMAETDFSNKITKITFETAAAEQQAGVAVQHRARLPPDRPQPLRRARVRGRFGVRTTHCGRRGLRGQLRPPPRDRLQPQLGVPAVGQPRDGQLRSVQTQRRVVTWFSVEFHLRVLVWVCCSCFFSKFCRILFLLLSRMFGKNCC